MNPLDHLRERLSRADALVPLSVVGVASGLASGVVILAFRLLIEAVQTGVLGLDDPEAYESLDRVSRVALPVAGGVVIGIAFLLTTLRSREVGVVHVMERLAYHSGRFPWHNAMVPFFLGAVTVMPVTRSAARGRTWRPTAPSTRCSAWAH